MKLPTRDIARGRWKGILMAMGLDQRYLRNAHGPCPLCGGSDRYRFDDQDGKGTYFCNSCGPGDGMQLAMAWTGKSFKDVAAEIDRMASNIDPTAQRGEQDDEKRAEETRKRLKRIGNQLLPLVGTDPVSRYLAGRGINTDATRYLRFHPQLGYYDQTLGKVTGLHPAMVAAFRRPDGSIETFHVTYLTKGGAKADVPVQRKVTGKQQGLSGCAIRLSEVERHIGIAEGIETALSVTQLYGIPCWSVYSAHGMETFEPPEGVEEISIFADTDENFAGQDVATTAARRLTKKGYKVRLAPFLEPGMDYNDALMEALCQT
jgi:putative DNA primase/helicase